MADQGYRSIEIQVSNNLNANLTVEGSNVVESFIDGEAATIAQVINRDGIVTWGVKTDDSGGNATMTIRLAGLGGLTITATNQSNGKSSVQFSNVSQSISPGSMEAEGSTVNHSRYYVNINPS